MCWFFIRFVFTLFSGLVYVVRICLFVVIIAVWMGFGALILICGWIGVLVGWFEVSYFRVWLFCGFVPRIMFGCAFVGGVLGFSLCLVGWMGCTSCLLVSGCLC